MSFFMENKYYSKLSLAEKRKCLSNLQYFLKGMSLVYPEAVPPFFEELLTEAIFDLLYQEEEKKEAEENEG